MYLEKFFGLLGFLKAESQILYPGFLSYYVMVSMMKRVAYNNIKSSKNPCTLTLEEELLMVNAFTMKFYICHFYL